MAGMSNDSNDTSNVRHLIKVASHEQAFFCAEQQSVLDAGLRAGIKLPHSCRGGNCGSCLAQVRQGEFVYASETIPAGITPEQRRAGGALLCQVSPRSALVIDVPRAQSSHSVEVIQLPARIESREQVARDVIRLKLRLPRARPMAFKPGQYLDVLLNSDSGEQCRRSYSMASLTGSQNLLELHVRRVAGGLFSAPLFAEELSSSLLKIEGPFGTFGWQSTTQPAVLIASGTGFAPIKAMLLDEVVEQRRRPLSLFWQARDAQDFYDLPALLSWQKALPHMSITLVWPQQHAQDVDLLAGFSHLASNDFEEHITTHIIANADAATDYYVCGAPRFVSDMHSRLSACGIEKIYRDSFDPATR